MLAYAVTAARQQLVAVNGRRRVEAPADAPLDDGKVTFFLSTYEQKDVENLPDGVSCDITNLHRVNDVRYINKFFKAVNRKLPPDGRYTGCAETIRHVKQGILSRRHVIVGWMLYVLLCIAKRVIPKLPITKKIYFYLTKGRSRWISRAELMGRLICCGFEIESITDMGDQVYFTAKKSSHPLDNPRPSYGPIFKTRRKGKDGRDIEIYKLRTMYPFSEFLQSYVYEKHNLSSNGKFHGDFRVSTWGRCLRKVWLDELPMLFNWFKGDVKLVGVRPLSEQYIGLYPRPLAEKRLRYRPGLIPPFYADLPERFEQILESEETYLRSYEKHPIKTDAQYLCRAVYNIVVQGARSA